MSDRREPQVAAILRRIEHVFTPQVLERIGETLAAELARTDDTATVVVELPDTDGARVTIKGFAPTMRQRAARLLTPR